MAYPKWIYHRTLEAKIVNSEEEHKASGPLWKDTPAAFEEPETYREHMAEWESKEEKKPKRKKKAE